MDTERWKYKWVILATALQSDGLTFGLVFAVGVLYKDWIRYFDSSASFLSLVGSSPSAVSSIFGNTIFLQYLKQEILPNKKKVFRC